ncbi:MerR family transcriptional regulator [Solibacillus sp. A46]|uniref:MerR family transcriptional regulator n=1 Tax=Solibacillus faecavium TaxID=2762221 RepID=A0ABR8Y206_9BACL|nr:MerR family transcriptional regulator [Solibacillus faecavium]MBD8038234.1 MerR family transcriptional regulator [Solibacillus faecavium]
MEEKLYSIGEVSKLANISIQTLRYYDQIGLFKPSHVDRKTNYRYYKDAQLYYLDIIKSLKYIGVSLEEIKAAQAFTPAELLSFLQQQENVIEKQINRMYEIKQSLYKTKKQMEEQLAIDMLDTVYFKNEETNRILSIHTNELTPYYIPNTYYSSLIKTLEVENSLLSNRYGCIYPYQPYNSLDELHYSHIFTPLITDRYITHLTTDMEVKTIPAGRYVCIAFIFEPDTYLTHYQKLYQYIEENRLEVVPIVYEIFMPINYSPNKADEFIVELKIKLK